MSFGVWLHRGLLQTRSYSNFQILSSFSTLLFTPSHPSSSFHQTMAISTTTSPSLPPPQPKSTKPLQLPEIVPPLAKDATQNALTSASRDFRSDTITVPTQNMGLAMAHAAGGDNVYNDDLTTNAFEASVAALLGKESGLFVPSGTMSNQLCLRTWLMQPPYSIVCDQRAHIHQYEAGGCAFHSGAAMETIIPANGLYLTWNEIESRIIPDDDNTHHAPTRIVSLENTINGVIMPQEEIVEIAENLRRSYPGIRLHLDGARIWHVAVKTGKSLQEICQPFDSISVCFSKGLGAPIGSMMIGPKKFIHKAKHFRKLFGAGMRQVGVLSAAARIALEETFNKLEHTHHLASWLANELEKSGAKITYPVDTNMIWFDPAPMGISLNDVIKRGAALPNPYILNGNRVVIHHQTDPQALQDLLSVIHQLQSERS